MREQDIMYLSELIENRIISYCIKEEGSLQEHLNIGEELAHRAMIQALHNIVGRGTSKQSTKQLRKLCITTDSFDVYRYEREIERQDIEESKEKDKNGETVIVKKIVRKIVGSFKQFPIKIAWAMSIHKSQGQTFGQVNIDPRCWDSGQFYVAVSRAESVAGIHFMAPIMKQYIRTLSDEVIKILRESLYSII